MAVTQLQRVISPVGRESVATWVTDRDALASEPSGEAVDLSDFRRAVDKLLAKNRSLGAKTDARLAEPLHASLNSVRRRVLLDPRTWHWLTICEYPDYVLARWADGLEPGRATEMTTAQLGRFIGNATLAGRSRNALARLYWGADMAYSATGDYSEVATVFANSDLLVGVAERQIGLDPVAGLAIMNALKDLKEKQRRKALTRLNHVLSTTALESLSSDQVVELLGVA